jgi:hypothetical protein
MQFVNQRQGGPKQIQNAKLKCSKHPLLRNLKYKAEPQRRKERRAHSENKEFRMHKTGVRMQNDA